MTLLASIEFAQPAKTISQNGRLHWTQRAGLTRVWRMAAFVAARNAGVSDLAPCSVVVTFTSHVHRRRDANQLAPTTKAIVDGLVDAKVWPDDTTEWVVSVSDRVVVARDTPRTVRVDLWLMTPERAA